METKTEIKLSLKIPFELNEKLIREAEKEKRSRHSQIIYSLEKLFGGRTPDGNGTETNGNVKRPAKNLHR